MSFIQTEEGKAVPTSGGGYNYTYYLGDNLGNTRVTFDTQTGAAAIVQADNYYPFGMEQSVTANGTKNEYLYNRKELQEELGLYDYGWRQYDPVVVHWNSIDPLAEKSRRWGTYNYVMGNPIRLIDPDGCDTAQRNAAVREAEVWKNANQNGKGDTYHLSAKGAGGPGSEIDCSGLISKCVEAGGESDPNHPDSNGKSSNGITNIDNNLPDVDPKDVVPGNLVLMNDDHHGGIVKSVEIKDGKINNLSMIASGGVEGSGKSGPKENAIIVNGKPVQGISINAYKKFDTKPDSEPGNKGVNPVNQSHNQPNQVQSKNVIMKIVDKLVNFFGEGNYQ